MGKGGDNEDKSGTATVPGDHGMSGAEYVSSLKISDERRKAIQSHIE